jgi:beta-lactamase regulating signal transducer with metallopeptidase domain
MNDVFRALGIAAGILSLVVILIVIISIVVVKRGEAEQRGANHDVPDDSPRVKEAAAPPLTKSAKLAGPATVEISVPQILLFGIGLFTLTILALLGVSLIEHLN